MSKYDDEPTASEELSEFIGPEGTRALSSVHGGHEIYIPVLQP